MRDSVEFTYNTEPPDGCSQEEFSVKLKDFFSRRFGPCEVKLLLKNNEKGSEDIEGSSSNDGPFPGTYGIVLKFDENSVANQIKQKYHASTIHDVHLYTSWWPRSANPYYQKGRGGRIPWRGSKFTCYTGPFRGGRRARGSFRGSCGSFGPPRGNVMFHHGSHHGSDSAYHSSGEHSTLKSERDSSPGSPPPPSGHSTHSTSSSRRHSSPGGSHHRASTHSSPSSSPPRRTRHVSIASSSSGSASSDHGGNEQSGHASSSISVSAASAIHSPVDSPQQMDSPLSVVAEKNKEGKPEGRVLRSHSIQHARSSEPRTRKALSSSQSQTGSGVISRRETSSHYNTRSKKKSLEEKEPESHENLHKKHQSGHSRDAMTDSDNDSSYRKQPSTRSLLQSGEKGRDQVRIVSMERVVTLIDSDSSPPRSYPQSSGKASGTGESSQSEEEVWVERKVEVKGRKCSLDEMEGSRETISPVASTHRPSGEERGMVEGPRLLSPSLHTIESQVTPAQEGIPMESKSPSVRSECGGANTFSSKDGGGNCSQLSNYGDTEGLTSTLMSPREERDETPPAELLEATHHLVQGELYSEWYRENFQNDPQALQRYLEYYQYQTMVARDREERIQETADGGATGQAVPSSDKIVNSTSDGGAGVIDPSDESQVDTSVQRTRSLPPFGTQSQDKSHDSRKRATMSLPPDLSRIESPVSSSIEGVGGETSGVDITYPPAKKKRNMEEAGSSGPLLSPCTKTNYSPLDATPQTSKLARRATPLRKVEKKYSHLQKHALKQFLLRSKPLVVSTQTLISYTPPSSEEMLLNALTTSLEHISEELTRELWSEIDRQQTPPPSP